MTVSMSAFSAQTIFKSALVDEDIFLAMMGKHVKITMNVQRTKTGVIRNATTQREVTYVHVWTALDWTLTT